MEILKKGEDYDKLRYKLSEKEGITDKSFCDTFCIKEGYYDSIW